MAVILGLNAFHPDSSVCLVLDGKLVCAVAEERLGPRHKHTDEFPVNAIRWALAEGGVRLRDVTHVAVNRQNRNWGAKLRYALANPQLGATAMRSYVERRLGQRKGLTALAEICDEDPAAVRFQLHEVEHHVAHIASSYYLSPFEELTAGFSYDGSGDFVSGMAARCEGNRIEVLDRISLPDSLGHFYTAMCQFIGFDSFGEEYKVMGLAPYGEDRYAEKMARIVRLDGTDFYRLDQRYFTVPRAMREAMRSKEGEIRLGRIYSDALIAEFGEPRRRADPVTQREMDIARSTQVMFERAASQSIASLGQRVPLTRLAMAGGCALNGVMNARILRDFPVEQVFLHPASSDDGTAVGAAFHCWHMGLGRTERFEMTHSFWGPQYGPDRIRSAADASGFPVQECGNDHEVTQVTADHIAGGAIVGWYQGRSEWGPRALGNRSILANPAMPGMKALINQKIKKRESFRPFAPSVLREDISRYFEQDIASPFMMHVVKFKPEWRETFPAVTHVDGTGRMQSVDPVSNALYHQLITAVKQRTGHGIVLNTSFNENEPVVDTPEQAIACFKRTDMDVLVLGRFVLTKERSGDAAAEREREQQQFA